MTAELHTVTDNLNELLSVLPADLREVVPVKNRQDLIEIVLDLGRRPEARYSNRYEYLREAPVEREELDQVEAHLGAFGDDNRAGIPATLHRISAIRNRHGEVVGLTLRVGRAVTGIVDILRDLIESGDSLLLMGRPGLGKTTLLREMARVLADEMEKRVVIVDTSNEIAGDGDVPHPAIGRARRMQVAKVAQQSDVMIEAVENHMPEVVVIDEIGRIEETMAARTIAERGVQLIATVHGNTLDNLLANPAMSDLIGGVQAVTLSDDEARRRRTQKTVLERKAPPTFNVVVEMIDRDQIAVRRPVAEAVDGFLRGHPAPPELRRRDENGEIHITQPSVPEANAREERDFRMKGEYALRDSATRGDFGARKNFDRARRNPNRRGENSSGAQEKHSARDEDDGESTAPPENKAENDAAVLLTDAPLDVARVRNIYPFGLSRSRLTRAIKHLGLPLSTVRRWQDADAVLMLASANGIETDSSLLREARELNLPIVGVRGNTYGQIVGRLNGLFNAGDSGNTPRQMAVEEARRAAQRVMAEAEAVELRPQTKPQRRLQHQIAERFHLRSYSVGRDPNRRVRFLPRTG